MTANKNTLVEQVQSTCPKFCEALTTTEVETFVEFCTLVEAEPNQVLADIGEVGEEGGRELEVVGRIEAGCLVGEMSFFDRQPRTIRIRTKKKTGALLLSISRPMYKRLCVEHPYISVNLLEFVVMSLDKLIRNSSKDMATMYRQVAGIGYR